MASQAMVFMRNVTVHNIMKFVATDSVGCLSCEKDTVLLHGRSVFPKPNSPFYSQAAEVHLMQTRLASKKRLASVTQNCCQETQHGETTWRCRSWCERQLLVHSLLHHGSFEWCDHRFAKLLELSYRPCCWAGRKKRHAVAEGRQEVGLYCISFGAQCAQKGNGGVFRFCPLPLQVSFSPTCSDGCSSSSMAILELRKWGSHCGAKKKVGGKHKYLSHMVFFWLLWFTLSNPTWFEYRWMN